MGLVDRISSQLVKSQSRDYSLSLDEWAAYFEYGGMAYPLIQTTMGSVNEERIVGNAVAAYAGSSAVFALIQARVQAFSQVAFQWTRFDGAMPGDLFGTQALAVLEDPWPGGKTVDLLARMEVDNCIAGNSYICRPRKDRLARLRPEQVTIILGSRYEADYPADAPDVELAGYLHRPRSGLLNLFLPDEIAHYAPMPDPNFAFLGMSWLTPCIREVQADSLATEHKARFFQNAAPLPMDARILTPRGWATMGDMALGHEVIGSDGRAHRVTGVFPQGEQQIYRVVFSDGATAECTADHQWQVASAYDRKRGVTRTMMLSDLVRDGLRYRSGPAKWSVPLVEPVEYEKTGELPVDPYLVGLLLGDGCMRGKHGASLAADARDADELGQYLRGMPDMKISRRDRQGWSEFCFRDAGVLRGLLEALGLWGSLGPVKRIPGEFMLGSATDRLALLQGLLDTDGSVSSRQPNLVRFTSTSWQLSGQVADLARSLGGTARITRLEKPGGRPQWQVTVKRLPQSLVPFRLARKAGRYQPPSVRAGRYRYITEVMPGGRRQAQCIRVDTPDSLFVTDDYVLTHNTPNLAIKFDPGVDIDTVKSFKALMEAEHKGAFNAYKCVTPETGVTLWDGRVVRADKVRPGDVLAAWSSEAEPGLVSRSERQPASPIVTVKTQRGRMLRTTQQHPYLTRRVVRRYDYGVTVLGDEGWTDAADLRPGDLVRVGLGWAHDVGKQDVVTPEQAWALGALTGDGGMTSSSPILTAADQGIRARMAGQYELRPRPARQRATIDYRVLGVRGLCDQMGMLGKRAWEKRIPVLVMTGSVKVQSAFLSGLVDTDGHVSDPAKRKSAEVGITSTSLTLLRDAQHVLAGLGVNASVSTPPSMAPDAPGEGLHRHQGHRLTVHGNGQAAILHGLLDLACAAKSSRLAEYASRPSRQRRSLYDRVVSVETGGLEPTIGIEVAGHHTHVTGGIVTHNTLYLGGGADPVPIGKDFQQLDFAATQGKGEARLAAAAGVPPSWVGFSEGLQGSALNAGNFTTARRRFSDGTMYHLWQSAAAALGAIVDPPPGADLWVDTRVPFMREDAGDLAAIQLQQAQTISALVMQGFTPASVVKAVDRNDLSLLKHSGLMSVQLHPPGSQPQLPPGLNGAAQSPAAQGGNGQSPQTAANVAGNGSGQTGQGTS